MASSFVLTPEQEAKSNESLQQALWGSLISFLIINNVAIGGRLWATRTSAVTRSRLLAEDVLITISGVSHNPSSDLKSLTAQRDRECKPNHGTMSRFS
jgi:hypothetical protein